MNDKEISASDLPGSASPLEVDDTPPDMNAKEMSKESIYLVECILRHNYHQVRRFLTIREGFTVEDATLLYIFVPEGHANGVLAQYPSQNNLNDLSRLPETLPSKQKTKH